MALWNSILTVDLALWLTGVGTLASIASMIVAIKQAQKAYKANQSARAAMATVQLSAVAERLKTAQEHIRDVAPGKVKQRGRQFEPKIASIRQEFDTALGALPAVGAGSTARGLLVRAQGHLNTYQSLPKPKGDPQLENLPVEPKKIEVEQEKLREEWQALQGRVQDAISDLRSTAFDTGEQQ
ncbi:hypothetical protein [Roseovarius tolerans]|uniref:hypothetical protein n=1 Tax=Roseovarius tolerans TaxID=74031 RepID=UPI0011137C02|nr:hypothetical protein [Roseovarius tolerans]